MKFRNDGLTVALGTSTGHVSCLKLSLAHEKETKTGLVHNKDVTLCILCITSMAFFCIFYWQRDIRFGC